MVRGRQRVEGKEGWRRRRARIGEEIVAAVRALISSRSGGSDTTGDARRQPDNPW